MPAQARIHCTLSSSGTLRLRVAGLEGGIRTPVGSAVDAARHIPGVQGFLPEPPTSTQMWKTSSRGGSMRQPHGSNVHREHDVPNKVSQQDFVEQQKWSRSWSGIVSHSLPHRLSGFCDYVACACLCLLSHVVFLTPLATLEQRAVSRSAWAVCSGERRAQSFRQAGARVATSVLVRDLDLLVPDVHDGRLLEIVAEGLSLFGGVSSGPSVER